MVKRLACCVALTAGALTLAACGGSAAQPAGRATSPATAATPATVSVGIMPIAASAAVQYGIREGIFEKHGLDVEVTISASGAAMLPAVASGQLDFAVGNPLSVATANDQGLDMRIIAGFSDVWAEGEDDVVGVVVRADSGIDDYADLENRTTAVVSLQTHGDLTLRHLAEQGGADPQKVDFAEMHFADMAGQLQAGNVDAIFVTEPFLGQALADPANRLLGYSLRDAIPGLPTLTTFTSGALVEEDPAVVERFREAIVETLETASAEEDAVRREVLPDFLDIPAEAAAHARWDKWNPEIRRGEILQLTELAARHGYLQAPADPEALFFE